jgi:hypothetical protein
MSRALGWSAAAVVAAVVVAAAGAALAQNVPLVLLSPPENPPGPHFTFKIAGFRVQGVDPKYTHVMVRCQVRYNPASHYPQAQGETQKFALTNGAFTSGPISIPVSMSSSDQGNLKSISHYICKIILDGPNEILFEPKESTKPEEVPFQEGQIEQ